MIEKGETEPFLYQNYLRADALVYNLDVECL